MLTQIQVCDRSETPFIVPALAREKGEREPSERVIERDTCSIKATIVIHESSACRLQ